MAKKPSQKSRRKLRPISELSRKQADMRRFARSLGMKDEHQLNRAVQRLQALPPSDPRHMPKNLPRDRWRPYFQKAYARHKKYGEPWQVMVYKKQLLVDKLDKLSPFMFKESYGDEIRALLDSSQTTQYGKQQLRDLMKELNKRSRVPAGMPNKNGQMRLF